MSKTLGRNDPCPCGSGKKYKRCCLAEDERRAAQERAPIPRADEDVPEAPVTLDSHQLPELLQKLASRASGKAERAEFQELLTRTQAVLDYMKQEPAIEAAGHTLEAHRAEFEKLLKDQKAFLERTQALFAEERFIPLRFTADDVQRAFDKVGRPAPGSSDDQFVATVRKAILHVADKERRNQLAMSLLLQLPDYVAAGRPLDACILQDCAYLTQEEPHDSNPALFQMFSYGHDSWTAQQRVRDAAVLRELGMDVSHLEGMSMEEIEAWMQEQQADPAKLARMEKVMQANPEQRAQAEANMEQLERDAHRLLEREDAVHLLLAPGEVQPWVPQMRERLESVAEQFPDIAEPSPSPATSKAVFDATFPLVSELVAKLFTPQRTRQLSEEVKAYRNARYAAGDKQTATLANGVVVSLAEYRDPTSNGFLYSVGYLSLMNALQAAS